MSDIPQPWTLWAERKGIRPTLRGIAEASGLAVSTLSRVLNGGRTSDDKITTLAHTLGVSRDDVYATLRLPAPGEDWTPTTGRWLTDRERLALDELVRVITAGRDQSVEDPTDPVEVARAEVEQTEGVPRLADDKRVLRELRSRLREAGGDEERAGPLRAKITEVEARMTARAERPESGTGTG